MTDIALLQARHIIGNRLADYCHAVDRQDAAAVAELFTGTALTFRGTHLCDADQIAEHYTRAFHAGEPTRHMVTDLHVTADPGGVSFSYRAGYQRWSLAGTTPACVAIGRYQGRFTRTGDQWSWSEHRITN